MPVGDAAAPRKAVFHPDARDEFNEILAYFETEAPAVVEPFREELMRIVAFIEEHPEAAPLERENVRCKLLMRFQYEVYYAVEPDRLRILAVAHQKKRPLYWLERRSS